MKTVLTKTKDFKACCKILTSISNWKTKLHGVQLNFHYICSIEINQKTLIEAETKSEKQPTKCHKEVSNFVKVKQIAILPFSIVHKHWVWNQNQSNKIDPISFWNIFKPLSSFRVFYCQSSVFAVFFWYH